MSPAKRIVILTHGTRGDVDPFLALGRGLLREGYAVRIAAPEPFRASALAHGLDFAGLEGDPDSLAEGLVGRAGLSWIRQVSVMAQYVLPLAMRVLEAVRKACQGGDAIIHTFLMTDAGHLMALEAGVPDLSAQFFPVFAETSSFPGVTFPDLPLGPVYRRLTHRMTHAIFRVGARLLYGRVRRAHPELPSLAAWPFQPGTSESTPILFAFSPHVVRRPDDWPSTAHVTGYWFLEQDEGWNPPEALMAFLSRDPPPVYVGLGTVPPRYRQLIDACARNLAQLGMRAVLSVEPGALTQSERPTGVFPTGPLPHHWLFPRMAAVVHHGGAGTTAAGLRAGVPNVVVPLTSDHMFWGTRVQKLGVGPRPIPLRRLTAERLAEALAMAVEDSNMRSAAQRLGEKIRAEDGVGRAVEIIRSHVGPPL